MRPRTRARTLQAHAGLVPDVGAQHLCGAAVLGLNVDVGEVEAVARRRRAAVDARRDVVPARARDVLPADVGDGEARGVAVVVAVCFWLSVPIVEYGAYIYAREKKKGWGGEGLGWLRTDTGRHVDGLVDVLKLDVAEGNVAHMAIPGVCLDPGRVARVDGLDVLKENVLHVVGLSGVGADAADGHDAGLVAGDIGHMDIGAVAFDSDAVLRKKRLAMMLPGVG